MDDDDALPRTAPPQQHPAPRYPQQCSTLQQDAVRSRRIDPDFLNPQRTIHFVHQANTVLETRTHASTAQKLSTVRLEHEIHRVANHAPSLDAVELESVDRQAIVRRHGQPHSSNRYDASQLVGVDAPTPIKPRQVKKQVTEAWKAAHAVAPSIDLIPNVEYGLETCISTPPLALDDAFFDSEPPTRTISRNSPRYLKESVVYFSFR